MRETMESKPVGEKVSPLREVEQNIDSLLKRIKCLLGGTIDIRLLITQGSTTRPEASPTKDRPHAEGRIDEMKLKLDECVVLISDIHQEHNEIVNQIA